MNGSLLGTRMFFYDLDHNFENGTEKFKQPIEQSNI